MSQVVFLVCTGLGRINRGYESFARECYDALKNTPDFKLILFKGGGRKIAGEVIVPNAHRKSKLATFLARTLKKDAYLIEQFTYFLFLIPYIIVKQPKVIYYSDFLLGTYLWHLRKWLRFKYKILFSNGAPNGPPYKTEDHVQQLLPLYVENGLLAGTPPGKQTLLPYGVHIDKSKGAITVEQILTLRRAFGLPTEKKIIISVGVINTSHKRMDYLVKEFSTLDQNKYFLLLLGSSDDESNMVKALGAQLLPPTSYQIKQVVANQVPDYLSASNYFVLASLNEGLPRVLVEALGCGLIPIVHDYPVTRQTLGKYGIFKDLTKPGSLNQGLLETERLKYTKEEIIRYAWDHYSWFSLQAGYTNMLIKLLKT